MYKNCFLNNKYYLNKNYCKKSKKFVKKLLTLQYLNVILYEQPQKISLLQLK